jgi:Delta7-sterol 5-desaturase
MDLVLEIADHLFLDKVYAKLIPASAFAGSVNSTLLSVASSLNSSLPVLTAGEPSLSAWSNIISYLPHPPLPEIFAPAVSSAPQVSAWPRDYIPRQLLSLLMITLIGIHVLYFLFAGLSYKFIFNHEMMKHPKFLKNQIKLEIESSLRAFPVMTVYTLPWFLAEVRGYSQLYTNVNEYGWGYMAFSIILYVAPLYCLSFKAESIPQ